MYEEPQVDDTIMEVDLITYLKGRLTINSIVGQRVFPVACPQGTDRPYIVLRRVSGGYSYDLGGPQAFSQPLIELMCVADDYATSKVLAKRVWMQLAGFGTNYSKMGNTTFVNCITCQDEQDEYMLPITGEDFGTFAVTSKYSVTYKIAVTKPNI